MFIFFSGYLNSSAGGRTGYYFSAAFVILGSLIMLLIDVHRKNLRKKKRARQESKKALAERISVAPDGSVVIQDASGGGASAMMGDPEALASARVSGVHMPPEELLERRNSFTDQDDILPPVSLLSHQRSFVYDDVIDLKKPELTIYSEEGIADMDLPDNILLDDFDYLDNITSCNKVENCLMLSEYEQNLIKETEGGPVTNSGSGSHRRPRKWSLFRQPTLQTINSEDEEVSVTIGVGGVDTRAPNSKAAHANSNLPGNSREIPRFPNPWRFRHGSLSSRGRPKRAITVIEEASV